MAKITLHKIVFSKEKLKAVPDCQRAVLVYAGHISNELNWFKKSILFLQQSSKEIAGKSLENRTLQEQAVLDGCTTQMMILVRLLAAKTSESTKFLHRWCFGMPWFAELCDDMDSKGKSSLNELNQYLSAAKNNLKNNILYIVRNKIAFHYDEEAVKHSINVPDRLEEFTTYLAENVGNTLYVGSENIVTDYLVETIKPGHAEEVIDQLMNETLTVSGWIQDVLGHTLSGLIWKHIGQDLPGIGKEDDIEMEVSYIEDQNPAYFVASKRDNQEE